KARAGRPHAHHRGRRVFSRRRRRHYHVRAGAPPRIVGTLVLAADLRRDGPGDRVYHRRRAAGFGAMGDRPPGRGQPRARRRVAGRHGARRAPILTPHPPPIMRVTRPNGWAIEPAMIMIAANSYWYFCYDSSLA